MLLEDKSSLLSQFRVGPDYLRLKRSWHDRCCQFGLAMMGGCVGEMPRLRLEWREGLLCCGWSGGWEEGVIA